MEVMTGHTTTHDTLQVTSAHEPCDKTTAIQDIHMSPVSGPHMSPVSGSHNMSPLPVGANMSPGGNALSPGANMSPMRDANMRDANNTIACQTALSYARQDTLVPLTALLQLVNNSILTVMENIEKVLLVNSTDENIFSADSINSFWNAANASASTSPTNSGQERISPTDYQEMRETEQTAGSEEGPENEKLLKPIVIQDRFQNSLEIPSDNDGAPPAEKRFCPETVNETLHQRHSPSTFINQQQLHGHHSPITPTCQAPSPMMTSLHQNNTSLSPTVNVAGSLTKYICPYCYKVFNWKTNMNRHISVNHLMKPKPAIKVPIMRKSKPYTCPICGNTFAWRSNMNRHILHLHKIDHKQLNKLLLSAYLPDLRNTENNSTNNIPAPPTSVNNEVIANNFSSLGSLTMLPQQTSFKTVTPSPPPVTTTANNFPPVTPTSPNISFLYRNHKALLESVKKEQVPLHVKEAALTSFYQNNKALFDVPATCSSGSIYNPQSQGLLTPTQGLLTHPKPDFLTPPKQEHDMRPKLLSPPSNNISNLSALYQAQKALIEQRNNANSAPAEMPITSIYHNHRAMLDTVSLLSNLNAVNINNMTNAGNTDVDVTHGIKVESTDK